MNSEGWFRRDKIPNNWSNTSKFNPPFGERHESALHLVASCPCSAGRGYETRLRFNVYEIARRDEFRKRPKWSLVPRQSTTPAASLTAGPKPSLFQGGDYNLSYVKGRKQETRGKNCTSPLPLKSCLWVPVKAPSSEFAKLIPPSHFVNFEW